MCEVFNYIFGSLKSSETEIKGIQKTLKQQTRINRDITVLVWVMSAYVIVNDIQRYKQNKKIKKLENEITQLKQTEGE